MDNNDDWDEIIGKENLRKAEEIEKYGVNLSEFSVKETREKVEKVSKNIEIIKKVLIVIAIIIAIIVAFLMYLVLAPVFARALSFKNL